MKATCASQSRWWISIAMAVALIGSSRARGAEEEGNGAAFQAEELVAMVQQILDEGEKAPPQVLGDVDLRTAPPEVKRVAKVLRETRIDISIEKQGLAEVIKVLRETSGLNFAISPRARAALAEEKQELTLSLRRLPLENVLNLLALQMGKYRFTLREGLVYLIREEEYRPAKSLRFYNVTDLIRPRPDFAAPQLALSMPGEKK
jgi:hypothetical protein